MRLRSAPDYARSYFSSGPAYLILYVTGRCNHSCSFCFYSSSLNRGEGDGLSLDDITRIGRSLRHCVHVTLTGGEPLLRSDLAEVADTLVLNAGTRNITVPSNGSLPSRTERVFSRLCRRHPSVEFRLALSIDGLPDVHDDVRGRKGSFTRAVETFHRIKRLQSRLPNLHLVLATVVSRYNKERTAEFIDYAAGRLRCDDHTLLLARGRTPRDEAKDVDGEEYHRLVGHLRNSRGERCGWSHRGVLKFVEKETARLVSRSYRDGRRLFPCVAGRKMLVIYHTGEVHPCEILQTREHPRHLMDRFQGSFSLGNVRDWNGDVTAMLRSKKAADLSRWIVSSRCHCTFECAAAASLVFNPRVLAASFLSSSLRSGARAFSTRSKTMMPLLRLSNWE